MAMNGPHRYSYELSRARETHAEPRREVNHPIGTQVYVRIFRSLIFAPLYCGGLTLVCGCSGGSGRDVSAIPPSAPADQEIARIWKEFGVRVHVKYDPDSYFHTIWKRAPISAHGIQIEPDGAIRITRLIPDFLAMYPRALIADNLSSVYLLKSLSFYGLEYGGTYSGADIYITSHGDGKKHNDLCISALMHSEFSSILYRNYAFPTEEWGKINESGWRYVGSGKDVLGRPNLYDQTEDSLRKGFICAYSEASLEEDVNMYVFAVIYRRFSLIRAAARHKRVKQKLEVLTRFYERISHQLNISGEFEFLIRLRSTTAPPIQGPAPPLFVVCQGRSDLRGSILAGQP
jgi:hypothetical protein